MSGAPSSDVGFQVGEVAVMCNFVVDVECNGVECVIERGLHLTPSRWRGQEIPPDWMYGVRETNGSYSVIHPSNLRKKRPPREDLKVVRWDQCPWQPEKISV